MFNSWGNKRGIGRVVFYLVELYITINPSIHPAYCKYLLQQTNYRGHYPKYQASLLL